MAEPRNATVETAGVGRTATARMNYFVSGNRQEALAKWGPKIRSFQGSVEYDKTDDLDYMTKVANDALKHFGLKADAQMYISRRTPAYTDYSLLINGDKVAASYRQYGSDDRKIGANLQDMVETAILLKMRKNKEGIMNAMGGIEGLKWKWIGPRK